MSEIEKEFEKLIEDLSDGEKKKLVKAWKFAEDAHKGQLRLSGDPYIIHPLEVAKILLGWKLDTTSVMAGLLHDTVEDNDEIEIEDITQEFGEDVSLIVSGVTKVTDIRLKGSREEMYVENLRKMVLVMAKDLRVVLVKLADRLHNMRTLKYLPLNKQHENALETLEIYAPLAERLGIGGVKGELEDLAFQFVYPGEYEKTVNLSQEHYKNAFSDIYLMKKRIVKGLSDVGIEGDINGRRKHLYSLWKKLTREEIKWDFSKVNDVVALRVIVGEISECYNALGVVHALYKPVPYIGISDFIAQPKPNGYRSIHTKVFGPRGRVVEIQIRTKEMHEQAEYGIAAHWSYSEKKSKEASDSELEKGFTQGNKLSWVKQLVKWQDEIKDSREFLRAVKFDVFGHRNFVFSPKGDVYDLPAGSTPVDFAFAIHTDMGKYIKGAKVNGKVVSLDYKLESGQVVEIVKSKNVKKPSARWLDFVVTTSAVRNIKREIY